uniref:Uncharacterized protein n=1 Tax=Anguilla anguilla TaxID=7936 RepID=A0A0E9SHK5_ANGAN
MGTVKQAVQYTRHLQFHRQPPLTCPSLLFYLPSLTAPDNLGRYLSALCTDTVKVMRRK